MPESYLQNTELYGLANKKLIYNGNTVFLINETASGQKIIDQNGVYKYEYKFQKIKSGYQVRSIKYYDSTGVLLDANSIMKYSQCITKWTRNGQIKETLFLDKNGKLTMPAYIGYARNVRIEKKDGVWINKYYDANNRPRCGINGFIIEQKWDTLYNNQNEQQTYFLRIKILSILDCNKNSLPIP